MNQCKYADTCHFRVVICDISRAMVEEYVSNYEQAISQLHDHMSFDLIHETLKGWVICIVNQNRSFEYLTLS